MAKSICLFKVNRIQLKNKKKTKTKIYVMIDIDSILPKRS